MTGNEPYANPFKGAFENPEDIDAAAALLAAGEPLAVDNDTVWGIWGDATKPSFADRVYEIKSRDQSRPLGLTVGFETVMPLVDTDRVHQPNQSLVEDPMRLTELLGGLAFVRMPGNQQTDGLPLYVVSYDNQLKPVIQNYDPAGKENLVGLLDRAVKQGMGLPAVTSLNASGETEITDPVEAEKFNRRYKLASLADTIAKRTAAGSYPIVNLCGEALEISREGNIAGDILKNILHDYDVVIARHARKAKRQLEARSLEASEQLLRGAELAEAVRETFGWNRPAA